MQYKILSPLQAFVLSRFFQSEIGKEDYYLSGGTALAEFYLQHRYSDDLDFFLPCQSFSDEKHQKTAAFFQSNYLKIVSTQHGETNLRYFVSPSSEPDMKLKVEFCTDPHPKMDCIQTIGDIRVDSLEDIAVNKVCCIVSRAPIEPKDVYDLYFILNNTRFVLDYLFVKAREKDATFDDEFGQFVFAQNLLVYCQQSRQEVKPLVPRMVQEIPHEKVLDFIENLARQIVERVRPRKR